MVLFNVQAEGPFNFQAAEAIPANSLVKLDTASKLVATGAGGRPIGIIYDNVALGGWVAVHELRGIVQGRAGAAINAGELVKAGAAGGFAPETDVAVTTLATLGVSTETVAAADPIHVLCSD